VVTRAFILTMIGSVIGAAGVLAAQGIVRQFVFGVTPGDPMTLVSVIAVLTGVALMACMIPAWRAAHVDPAVTLRE
jgi:ABC-type lipoprotein release transport system permease subunit